MIRRATPRDIADIYDISKENSIYTLSNPGLNSQGFLVSDYTPSDYRNFLDDGYTMLVAEVKGHVAGFALLADAQHHDPDDLLYQRVKKFASSPFVIVKQVCVGLHDRGQGVGSKLYAAHALNDGRDVYAAIVNDRKYSNQRSVLFHGKHGFRPAFTFTGSDQLQRVVYKKP